MESENPAVHEAHKLRDVGGRVCSKSQNTEMSNDGRTAQPMNVKTVTDKEQMLSKHPVWNRDWETGDNDQDIILVPKFGSHRIGRWLMARMKQPHYRIKLDEIGTFVWRRCDGKHSIQEIGQGLAEQFGDRVEPVFDRLLLFVTTLQRSKAITWE